MDKVLSKYMEDYGTLVENYLQQLCKSSLAMDEKLAESMAYSLLAGGKRLRPILLMASAALFGKKPEDYLQTACALEFIHTYSLIHDDLPAMDNDDYRRGKLTNHKVYGDGMAILAGDALLTMAFDLVVTDNKVEPQARLAMVQELARGAGSFGMVGGQAIDLEAENKNIPLEQLKIMHGAKTGALFEVALRGGAIIGGASQEELAQITKYAKAFGLVFQITDDILDCIGEEEKIGKPVGSDQRNHKSTYVSLLSLAEAQKLAVTTAEEGVKALETFGTKGEFLRLLINYLISRDK